MQTLQAKRWGPVLEWFENRFGIKLSVTRGLETMPLSTDARAVLARHLLSYDFTSLNGNHLLNTKKYIF